MGTNEREPLAERIASFFHLCAADGVSIYAMPEVKLKCFSDVFLYGGTI